MFFIDFFVLLEQRSNHMYISKFCMWTRSSGHTCVFLWCLQSLARLYWQIHYQQKCIRMTPLSYKLKIISHNTPWYFSLTDNLCRQGLNLQRTHLISFLSYLVLLIFWPLIFPLKLSLFPLIFVYVLSHTIPNKPLLYLSFLSLSPSLSLSLSLSL